MVAELRVAVDATQDVTPKTYVRPYFKIGPFDLTRPVRFELKVPLSDSEDIKLKVQVTVPERAENAALLLMFNGFKCDAEWYRSYVNHVASWGYVVAQYTTDTELYKIVNDVQEVTFLQPVLQAVKCREEVRRAAGFEPLMAVMGHSRGGKLATLHYARGLKGDGPRFETAVLLDPVDGNPMLAHKPGFPSAVELMRQVRDGDSQAAGRPAPSAAIIGAGKKFKLPLLDKVAPSLARAISDWCSCNPPSFDYSKFAEAMPGSWQAVIPKAGHMNFCKGDLFWRALNGTDYTIPGETVINVAATVAVAWLDKHFQKDRFRDLAGGFLAWREKGIRDGVLTFVPDSI